MKNLLLMFITALSFLIGTTEAIEASELENGNRLKLASKYGCDYENVSYCGEPEEVEEVEQIEAKENNLATNQTMLVYMCSTNEGYFMLDTVAENENIIFVSFSDMPKLKGKLHKGKRFVGTFSDESLWELEGLTEVIY